MRVTHDPTCPLPQPHSSPNPHNNKPIPANHSRKATHCGSRVPPVAACWGQLGLGRRPILIAKETKKGKKVKDQKQLTDQEDKAQYKKAGSSSSNSALGCLSRRAKKHTGYRVSANQLVRVASCTRKESAPEKAYLRAIIFLFKSYAAHVCNPGKMFIFNSTSEHQFKHPPVHVYRWGNSAGNLHHRSRGTGNTIKEAPYMTHAASG